MNKADNTPRVFGIIGWKNTGKTHLVERLVAVLVKRGYRVATIKHAHHSFDIDHKGRDSYRHRMAGASQVMVVSESRFALMAEGMGAGGVPDLSTLLAKLEPTDFVLLEGFKTAPLPKIECYRGGADKLLAHGDKTIVGIASDTKIKTPPCPVLDLNDTDGLCDFIIKHTSPNKSPSPKKSTMPKGVDWTAVADVLDGLKTRLTCTLPSEQIPTPNAGGRILSADITASQANPPFANSAVDGYGFAQASLSKSPQTTLTVTENHATAGAVIDSPVGTGLAIPILTGAPLPAGVECVVLQESVTKTGGKITFPSNIKRGANTRAKGEDIAQGAKIFAKGHRITPQDLAVLCATGVAEVPVYRPLRVGVLSSGDEVIAIGQNRTPAQIYDANQPMLLDILRKWGYHAVALGRVQDSADSVAKALSSAATKVDAIITTGGASTGDKDHIAAVLKSRGTLHDWRIAIKPGRPLA
ncbi:MAG: molybdopterin-guanine dinucleotide biosynthesis protein B, partial [Proteobacteria bacterium]|nr:molybdopterin-guanine dinucleotide biosynthesis protein B [Pseudomonadota bacterium]